MTARPDFPTAPLTLAVALLCVAGLHPATAPSARAQGDVIVPAGIHLAGGATLSIGAGSEVIVIGGDVYVEEGATLHNEGELHVGRDLVVDGTLTTAIGGTPAEPTHGRIYVAADAEYRGALSVDLADGARFAEPQDFALVHYGAAFGELAPERLPGALWSAHHRGADLIVRLGGRASLTRDPHRNDGDGDGDDAAIVGTDADGGPGAFAPPRLRAFPNPVLGTEVTLLGVDHTRRLASVELLSAAGQVVRRVAPAVGAADEQRLAVPARLPGGAYVVSLRYRDGARQSVRLVVAR